MMAISVIETGSNIGCRHPSDSERSTGQSYEWFPLKTSSLADSLVSDSSSLDFRRDIRKKILYFNHHDVIRPPGGFVWRILVPGARGLVVLA